MKKYDDILIGSGPAAYKMSNLLAQTDRRVLVIEGFDMGVLVLIMDVSPKFFWREQPGLFSNLSNFLAEALVNRQN